MERQEPKDRTELLPLLKVTGTELPTSPVRELSYKHTIKLFPQAALRLARERHQTATSAVNTSDTSAHTGYLGHSHLPDCPSSFTQGCQVQEDFSRKMNSLHCGRGRIVEIPLLKSLMDPSDMPARLGIPAAFAFLPPNPTAKSSIPSGDTGDK